MLDDPPTVALDSDYIETHGAEPGCPERELWRAVLRQAGEDLFSANEEIRAAAKDFFMGDDLALIAGLAGIDQSDAPWLRSRALDLAASAPSGTPMPSGKLLTYHGKTRNIKGWAAATGLSIHILGRRLRNGWTIERTLSVPMQAASGHSRKRKIRPVHPAKALHP